jgi:hypothetical protein
VAWENEAATEDSETASWPRIDATLPPFVRDVTLPIYFGRGDTLGWHTLHATRAQIKCDVTNYMRRA